MCFVLALKAIFGPCLLALHAKYALICLFRNTCPNSEQYFLGTKYIFSCCCFDFFTDFIRCCCLHNSLTLAFPSSQCPDAVLGLRDPPRPLARPFTSVLNRNIRKRVEEKKSAQNRTIFFFSQLVLCPCTKSLTSTTDFNHFPLRMTSWQQSGFESWIRMVAGNYFFQQNFALAPRVKKVATKHTRNSES